MEGVTEPMSVMTTLPLTSSTETLGWVAKLHPGGHRQRARLPDGIPHLRLASSQGADLASRG
jgi:hypothetical protein